MIIARVELDVPVSGPFDYESDVDQVALGSLVAVPFGRRRLVGVVVELAGETALDPAKLKRIERLLPVAPLPQSLLALGMFCADYYRHPLGQVLSAALPTMLRKPDFGKRARTWFYTLTAAGAAELPLMIAPNATGQRRLYQALKDRTVLDTSQARLAFSGAKRLLDNWIDAGWVDKQAGRNRPASPSPGYQATLAPVLTMEQTKAVGEIGATLGSFTPWLLYGVTGSGKTEVYLALIDRVITQGNQVLLLVPEINLTPQLEAYIRGRFPGIELVSLHSGLAEGERLARWESARSGSAAIVLGTRLGVFTPLPRLGLVIVDEEHDGSFKQGEGLRYHARDLAVYVARSEAVPVILGSATPSLETYANALEGRYRRVMLTSRPEAQAPSVRLVDVRGKRTEHGLSNEVVSAIADRVRRREQVLVYINRRGFAPVLLCNACGWMAECSRCSARLTLHSRSARLKCHYCGHEERITVACPQCGNLDLHGLGQGTQRVEDALNRHFPDARILRIDSDSTRRRGAFATMREQVRSELVDILVGTQMLAKGHDFPKLTLVVIVGSDHALYSSDYRASEHLFQQLMQVAGRAGRAALPGEVLLQTEFPQHPVYQALQRQDFPGFAQSLLDERRRSGFPPYVNQALLRADAHKEDELWSFLAKAGRLARSCATENVTIYDAVPAPVFKVAGRYRGQILLQAPSRNALRRFLPEWQPLLGEARAAPVRWVIDVDPIEI